MLLQTHGKISQFQPTLPARGATRKLSTSLRSCTFQPTLPARGATFSLRKFPFPATHFNPRSPHGERPAAEAWNQLMEAISTHAPRTGSDLWQVAQEIHTSISTHAPRTGSDQYVDLTSDAIIDFNPRSPHGERPQGLACLHLQAPFQPTLPARGATIRLEK